jgi:hypothetical protein
MKRTPPRPGRSTDRVALVIQIRIFGSDVEGRAFSEDARTLAVSRNGAMILTNRVLTPQEEILIRRERTGKEAPAQVVGQVRKEPGGFVYGVRLLDPGINLWDINFLPLSESERAVGRTLLECTKCRLREVVYLEEFEIEVYHAHQRIHRSCKRCRESTIWKEAIHERTEKEQAAPRPSEAAPPGRASAPRSKNERRHARVNCRLRACIRYKDSLEDEVLDVNNVSRGGVCFVTRKYLSQGAKIEVALPYAPGVANIFVPAEIVRIKAIPGKSLYEYGAAYLKRSYPSG